MPELPDVTVYVEHLARRTVGHPLERVRLASPFVLRTAEPPLRAAEGRGVTDVTRLGKRIVFHLRDVERVAPADEAGDDALYLVIHLMVAGRFRWKPLGAGNVGRIGLAAFDFGPARPGLAQVARAAADAESGTLLLTEASTKKRASIHLVRGAGGLRALDPGGMEVMDATAKAFGERLRLENHTIKRTLTDPRILSGIGNAYSDEILHRARMSPLKLTSRFDDEDVARLLTATKDVLQEWTDRLRAEAGDFPEGVTAFRPEMAVHGKYGKPCPRCGTTVQRIRYADNEMNYCPTCQTEGKLLADRSLSRLLKGDWPKTLEELEARKSNLGASPPAATPAPLARPKRAPIRSSLADQLRAKAAAKEDAKVDANGGTATSEAPRGKPAGESPRGKPAGEVARGKPSRKR